jgi:hypothetical protein
VFQHVYRGDNGKILQTWRSRVDVAYVSLKASFSSFFNSLAGDIDSDRQNSDLAGSRPEKQACVTADIEHAFARQRVDTYATAEHLQQFFAPPRRGREVEPSVLEVRVLEILTGIVQRSLLFLCGTGLVNAACRRFGMG